MDLLSIHHHQQLNHNPSLSPDSSLPTTAAGFITINKGPYNNASSSHNRRRFRRSHNRSQIRWTYGAPPPPSAVPNVAPVPQSAAPNVAPVPQSAAPNAAPVPPSAAPNAAPVPVVAPSPPPEETLLGTDRRPGRARVFDELYFQINDDIQLMEDCINELNSIFIRIRRQKEHLDHVYQKS